MGAVKLEAISNPPEADWPNLFVGASFQVLEIRMYSCGLKLGSAAILIQNPFFEIASKKSEKIDQTVVQLISRTILPNSPCNCAML